MQECTRCGRCCKHFSMFTHLDRDEWARIVGHVQARDGGVLKVRRFDAGLQRFIVREYHPRLDDWDAPLHDDLLRPKDAKFTLCPFYSFNAETGLFGCDIHEIKSRQCKAFFCDGSERYGTEIELCDPCWIHDVPCNTRKNDGKKRVPPCELGSGCPDLEYRLQFFLAYARSHPGDVNLNTKVQYFNAILAKNIARFSAELSGIGLDPVHVRENVAYLEVLIELIEKMQKTRLF